MSESAEKTSNGVQVYESPVRRTQKKFNFWRGIYNKDKNYILGRTPKNWGNFIFFLPESIIHIWVQKKSESRRSNRVNNCWR